MEATWGAETVSMVTPSNVLHAAMSAVSVVRESAIDVADAAEPVVMTIVTRTEADARVNWMSDADTPDIVLARAVLKDAVSKSSTLPLTVI